MKFQLRKGSRKDICPSCHHKTFTPYVDESGTILSELVGICDRKDKCNYHYPPAKYFRDSAPLSAWKNYKHISGSCRAEAAVKKISTDLFHKSLGHYERNSLAIYLKQLFAKAGAEEFVELSLRKMGIGTCSKYGGSPVFWLVDRTGRIRDGKIMGYNRVTGKRVKDPYPLFTNVHTLLEKQTGDNYDNGSCYFGSHLLGVKAPCDPPVWLFESEKAAAIVAIALEWGASLLGLPMATGGCSNFNPTRENLRNPSHKLSVLRGRRLVLFPDEGKFEEWEQKGRQLSGFCKEVYISTAMERQLHPHEIPVAINPGDGFDDLIIRHIEAAIEPFTLLLTSYGYLQTHKLVG